jgi:transcription initiation factor TFIIIB Brf1 subunit/transcription initiation factor TFIIB
MENIETSQEAAVGRAASGSACPICGSSETVTDLEGLGRVIECANCGTRIPISLFESAQNSWMNASVEAREK